MNRISRNISIIFKAERLIAQRRMAVLRKQTGMMVCAGIAAGMALVMLNAAAYFALAERMSPASAALIVALVNLLLATVLAYYANRISADKDVEGVVEVRDMAMEDLEAEIADATAEVKDIAESLRRVARDPIGTALPGLITPLVGALLKNLRK